MPTNPKLIEATRIALLESIRHWHRHSTNTQLEGETIRGSSCALCKLFCSKGHNTQPDIHDLFSDLTPEEYRNCRLCPVMNKTKTLECGNSPWVSVRNLSISNSHDQALYKQDDFKAAATKERDFLISLLECEKDKQDIMKELGM